MKSEQIKEIKNVIKHYNKIWKKILKIPLRNWQEFKFAAIKIFHIYNLFFSHIYIIIIKDFQYIINFP